MAWLTNQHLMIYNSDIIYHYNFIADFKQDKKKILRWPSSLKQKLMIQYCPLHWFSNTISNCQYCGGKKHECHLPLICRYYCREMNLLLKAREITSLLNNATAENCNYFSFTAGYQIFRITIVFFPYGYCHLCQQLHLHVTAVHKAEVAFQYQHIPPVTIDTTCWSRKEFVLQGVDWPEWLPR